MDIWNFIGNHIENNRKIILITVVNTIGSSPGRVGFKMAVCDNGEIAGSIGGGVMEYNMVELARKSFEKKETQPFVKRQIHDSEAAYDKSGMICSGEQTHVFTPLSYTDISILQSIIDHVNNGEKGLLRLTANGVFFSKDILKEFDFSYTLDSPTSWEYKEQIGLKDTVYIFGAGHISVPLSQILRMLDFRVVVYDNRKELSTFISNSFANHKEVIDYHKVDHLVPESPNSYVAIMSFGHKFDQIILKQLLAKNLKYLGMIGSKSKVQSIYDSLRESGFSDHDFSRVDSPIGLSIKSQTPAEIAISIAAKIIQVRNS